MSIIKALTFFLICFLAACGNLRSNPPQPAGKAELSLKMERKPCGGTCPVYTLTIQPNGKVLFEGIEFTKTKGPAEGALSEDKIKQIAAEINQADFFALKDDYTIPAGNCPSAATDFANVILFINLNEREKTLKNNLGCFESDGSKSFPPHLVGLENKIDEIAETKRWIGENNERIPQPSFKTPAGN